jgi:hypothetical protein
MSEHDNTQGQGQPQQTEGQFEHQQGMPQANEIDPNAIQNLDSVLNEPVTGQPQQPMQGQQATGQTMPAANAAAGQPTGSSANTGPKDGAKVMLTNGMARLDYIRQRWHAGLSRGDITKEVNALLHKGSKPVPYQIIFAATKGTPRGTLAVSASATPEQRAEAASARVAKLKEELAAAEAEANRLAEIATAPQATPAPTAQPSAEGAINEGQQAAA